MKNRRVADLAHGDTGEEMESTAGTRYKQRNFPSLRVTQALEVARAIHEQAAGHPVSRLTLATLLDRSPTSSGLGELLIASRAFGFTGGGKNSDTFQLTDLGRRAAGGDRVVEMAALREAVLNVEPFALFLRGHHGKRVPAPAAMKAFVVNNASVPESRAEECADKLLQSARDVGFIRKVKGAEYVDIDIAGGAAIATASDLDDSGNGVIEVQDEFELDQRDAAESSGSTVPGRGPVSTESDQPAKKVFIVHGKDRQPLDQLKKILDKFGVKYAVAVDEAHAGRPISAKVASLMRNECSSAIFIFTADEQFFQEDEEGNRTEDWRPSENVIYELGAASILYDRRIVIFKEKRVTFPSDYSDLGHITFEAGSLNSQIGDLFSELVALDILEVRAKG
jgi:predicted nucleotide-binding protein